MSKKSIMLFRRDLRLQDNLALSAALHSSEKVYCFFILDERQIGSENRFYSARAVKFMVEALQSMAKDFTTLGSRLHIVHGVAENVVEKLCVTLRPDALFLNYDYTPFSRKRDQAIERICNQYGVAFNGFHDLLLVGDPARFLTGTGTPYQRYTPFFRKAWIEKEIVRPRSYAYDRLATLRAPQDQGVHLIDPEVIHRFIPDQSFADMVSSLVMGNRHEGIKKLTTMAHHQRDYAKTRDYPTHETTHLSAYLKFGLLSVRECFWHIVDAFGKNHPLIRQLYWRDFFTYLAFHTPTVFGSAYYREYRTIPWCTNHHLFERWQSGTTGFPLVDAGMRELVTTGFMHNRLRMITASFLIKDLHIDWQWGERFFAQHLIDYDPSVNNGNWQWVASTGADAMPYIRIFNPWTQQKRFDREGSYVKKWVPELATIPASAISSWYSTYKKFEGITSYPRPLVDHNRERTTTISLYTTFKRKD